MMGREERAEEVDNRKERWKKRVGGGRGYV